VEVYVGDEANPQYAERVACSDMTANVTLTGSGTQTIKVYFDGVLAQDQTQELQFE
jgi:hypothetical protein